MKVQPYGYIKARFFCHLNITIITIKLLLLFASTYDFSISSLILNWNQLVLIDILTVSTCLAIQGVIRMGVVPEI